MFLILSFGNLDLFRISDLEFRILKFGHFVGNWKLDIGNYSVFMLRLNFVSPRCIIISGVSI
jgi:hypothetical protein